MHSTLPISVSADGATRWTPASLAYAFYVTAAGGAVIGQTWVAVEHIPWPDGMHPLASAMVALPFAAVIELLGMATAAMADERQRAGERAVGFRLFSAAVAALAVAIIAVGHWHSPYVALAFGALSISAYLLWLLHAAARRRDALRQAGMLARAAPAYGWRWLRQPALTARAREVALLDGLDLAGSLTYARKAREAERAERHAEARRRKVARAARRVIRAEHGSRRHAALAVRVLDLDRIAADLQGAADYDWWRDRLAGELGIAGPADPPSEVAPVDLVTVVDGDQVKSETLAAVSAALGMLTPRPARPPLRPQAPAVGTHASYDAAAAAVEDALTCENTPGSPEPPRELPAGPGARAKPPKVTTGTRRPGKGTTADLVARMRARNPSLSNADVAARLKVSERTVQRTVAAMNGGLTHV